MIRSAWKRPPGPAVLAEHLRDAVLQRNAHVLLPEGEPVADLYGENHEIGTLERRAQVRSHADPVPETVFRHMGARGRVYRPEGVGVDVVQRDLGICEQWACKDVSQRAAAELGAPGTNKSDLRHAVIPFSFRRAVIGTWFVRRPLVEVAVCRCSQHEMPPEGGSPGEAHSIRRRLRGLEPSVRSRR